MRLNPLLVEYLQQFKIYLTVIMICSIMTAGFTAASFICLSFIFDEVKVKGRGGSKTQPSTRPDIRGQGGSTRVQYDNSTETKHLSSPERQK
jgi:hypothetical protein